MEARVASNEPFVAVETISVRRSVALSRHAPSPGPADRWRGSGVGTLNNPDLHERTLGDDCIGRAGTRRSRSFGSAPRPRRLDGHAGAAPARPLHPAAG